MFYLEIKMERLKFKCNELDLSKIHKLGQLGDEKEWTLMVYSQFGFNSYEEIKAFSSRHKDEWMNYFYWSKEIETQFLKQILSFYPKGRKQFQVGKYYNLASLNWFPGNFYDTFLNKHGEKEPNGKKN